jgi:hypothetical protein
MIGMGKELCEPSWPPHSKQGVAGGGEQAVIAFIAVGWLSELGEFNRR